MLILTSELIEPPPPVIRLVEARGSLQIMKPPDDEFLRIEIHGIAGTTFAQPSVMQCGGCEWIAAEEMQSPSLWSATLDTIEEGAMTVIQQALPKDVAMAVRDEVLTRQRDRP